jgi:hypothetical protein
MSRFVYITTFCHYIPVSTTALSRHVVFVTNRIYKYLTRVTNFWIFAMMLLAHSWLSIKIVGLIRYTSSELNIFGINLLPEGTS